MVAQQRGNRVLNILGDSLLIIKNMVNNSATKNSMLNQVMKRNKGLYNHFEKVNFYHILRKLNGDVDI